MTRQTNQALNRLMIQLQSATPGWIKGGAMDWDRGVAICSACEDVVQSLAQEPLDPEYQPVPEKK